MSESKASTNWKIYTIHQIAWLLLCYGIAWLGSWVTSDAVETWYQVLNRPSWNPPDYVFPIVWTVLFGMMAVAAARVSFQYGIDRSILVFAVHLLLNLAWSVLFFGFGWLLAAAIEIVFLLAMIAGTAWLFWKRDRLAGGLMVPYLCWVGFATYLNWTIVSLNPGGSG